MARKRMNPRRRRTITPEPRPSFFKLLISNNFTRKLRLVRGFVPEFKEMLSEDVRFVINSSGKHWDVKLKQMGDEGDYYFAGSGWRQFAQDMGLKIFELMLFWLERKSTFRVSVYATTACEREEPLGSFVLPSRTCVAEEEHEAVRSADDSHLTDSSDNSNNLKFEVVLKEHHRSRVTLPKSFVVAAGLIRKKKVSLVYLGGHRVYDVVLDDRTKKHGAFRIDLTAGWSQFRTANGLVMRKTYLFEFIPKKNVLQVKPLSRRNK